MIGHPAGGGNSNIPHFEGFFQQLRTHDAIRIIRKNFLGPPAAVHHMAPRIGIFHSKETRHNDNCLSLSIEKAKSRLDSFLLYRAAPAKTGIATPWLNRQLPVARLRRRGKDDLFAWAGYGAMQCL